MPTPPKSVQSSAKRGLELRRKFKRGGTEVGVARARDLSNGKDIPIKTINRMVSYFARHAVDKKASGWGKTGDPSPGYIAWLLWGGDAGQRWAKSQSSQAKKSKSLGAILKESTLPPKPKDEHGRPVWWVEVLSEDTVFNAGGETVTVGKDGLKRQLAAYQYLCARGYTPPVGGQHNHPFSEYSSVKELESAEDSLPPGWRQGDLLAMEMWEDGNGTKKVIGAVALALPNDKAKEAVKLGQVKYFSPELGPLELDDGTTLPLVIKKLDVVERPHQKTGATHILASEVEMAPLEGWKRSSLQIESEQWSDAKAIWKDITKGKVSRFSTLGPWANGLGQEAKKYGLQKNTNPFEKLRKRVRDPQFYEFAFFMKEAWDKGFNSAKNERGLTEGEEVKMASGEINKLLDTFVGPQGSSWASMSNRKLYERWIKQDNPTAREVENYFVGRDDGAEQITLGRRVRSVADIRKVQKERGMKGRLNEFEEDEEVEMASGKSGVWKRYPGGGRIQLPSPEEKRELDKLVKKLKRQGKKLTPALALISKQKMSDEPEGDEEVEMGMEFEPGQRVKIIPHGFGVGGQGTIVGLDPNPKANRLGFYIVKVGRKELQVNKDQLKALSDEETEEVEMASTVKIRDEDGRTVEVPANSWRYQPYILDQGGPRMRASVRKVRASDPVLKDEYSYEEEYEALRDAKQTVYEWSNMSEEDEVKMGGARTGQWFVIVNKANGKVASDELFKGTRKADAALDKMEADPQHQKKYPKGIQVIDAMWHNPSRQKLKKLGFLNEETEEVEMADEYDEEVEMADSVKVGDKVNLPNGVKGTVEKVRDADAWVVITSGPAKGNASWMPIEDIKEANLSDEDEDEAEAEDELDEGSLVHEKYHHNKKRPPKLFSEEEDEMNKKMMGELSEARNRIARLEAQRDAATFSQLVPATATVEMSDDIRSLLFKAYRRNPAAWDSTLGQSINVPRGRAATLSEARIAWADPIGSAAAGQPIGSDDSSIMTAALREAGGDHVKAAELYKINKYGRG